MHNGKTILFQNVLKAISIYIPLSLFAQIPLSPVFNHPETSPPFELLAKAPYQLCYDIHMSPYAGGEDLLFGTRLIEKVSTSLIKKTDFAYSKEMFARAWRLNEMTLVWLPLNYFTMVVQHEVFGHGYRIRDIHHGKAEVTGYHFSFPPPYGSGDASTHFLISSSITTTELTSIAMAGIESTAILANTTKLKWLTANRIDPRQTVLYLSCQYNLNLYASEIDIDDLDSIGHDLKDYVRWLQFTYPKGKCTVSRLRNLAWINLIDPFTYYSLFAWFHFLSSGKETKIPMIPIKGYKYLFGARLGLTPFGPEIFVENYLLHNKTPYYFYLKGGSHAKNKYWGAGLFAPHIWTIQKITLGSRFDIWRQPKLLLNPGNQSVFDIDFTSDPRNDPPLYSSRQQQEQSIGFGASLIASYCFRPLIEFQGEFGYKTMGFLPGYSLTAFPTVRLSYLATF